MIIKAVIFDMDGVLVGDLINARCIPFPIHVYALSTLKHMGYKLALASNSIRNTVDMMMQKAGLAAYLDFMFSSSDVIKPKPDPEIYTIAIDRLGFKPEECLVLEDDKNDIKAAIAAGAHVLAVKDIYEVNLDNILARIRKIETERVTAVL